MDLTVEVQSKRGLSYGTKARRRCLTILMRGLVLSSMFVVVVAWDAPADASCRSETYFAPSSGSRIPPGATIYAFPSFDTNVVVRVIGDGREIHPYTYEVEAGRNQAIAVSLEERDELRTVTIEVNWVSGREERSLAAASYVIDESVAEPAAGLEIEKISRSESEGLTACVSHDLLFFEPDVRAPAYRFEWARSEQAYRDGDRHVAIVKRSESIDGNVFSVGNSGCGQDVIPMLWREKTLFVGIAPVGYRGPREYRVPARPTKIELDELPNESWNELFGDRLVPPGEEPWPVRVELEHAVVRSTSVGPIVLGALLGLLLGWPIGLVIGRRVFRARSGAPVS